MSAMSRTGRALAGAILAAALAALAGCGSGGDDPTPPPPTPTDTSTAQTTTSPGTASPTTSHPSNAATPELKPTKQGAIETAIAAVRAIDHAYTTLDVAPLKRISAPECQVCRDMVKEFPRKRSAGFTVSGGHLTITGPAVVRAGSAAKRRLFITVPIKVSRLTTKDASGHRYTNQNDLLGSGPGLRGQNNTEVIWRQNTWKILSVGIQQ